MTEKISVTSFNGKVFEIPMDSITRIQIAVEGFMPPGSNSRIDAEDIYNVKEDAKVIYDQLHEEMKEQFTFLTLPNGKPVYFLGKNAAGPLQTLSGDKTGGVKSSFSINNKRMFVSNEPAEVATIIAAAGGTALPVLDAIEIESWQVPPPEEVSKSRFNFFAKTEPVPAANTPGNGSTNAAALKLIKSHTRWYRVWATFYGWAYNVLTMTVIIISGLSSIYIAAGKATTYPLTIATLPAVAALLTALLVQFRVRDMWQLREMGRLSASALQYETSLLPATDTAGRVVADIGLKLNEIERVQAQQFFAEPTPTKPAVVTPTEPVKK